VLNFSRRDLLGDDVRARVARAISQVTIKRNARVDRERLSQFQVKLFA
jgi:hypothetical protein